MKEVTLDKKYFETVLNEDINFEITDGYLKYNENGNYFLTDSDYVFEFTKSFDTELIINIDQRGSRADQINRKRGFGFALLESSAIDEEGIHKVIENSDYSTIQRKKVVGLAAGVYKIVCATRTPCESCEAFVQCYEKKPDVELEWFRCSETSIRYLSRNDTDSGNTDAWDEYSDSDS